MSPIAPPLTITQAANLQLSRDQWGELVLVTSDGIRHEGVRPLRLFPFSERNGWVSLASAKGVEIALIERLTDLTPATRNLLEEELSQREFVPVISRIVSVSANLEPCEWFVETDRGEISFVLKSEEDMRRLGPDKALIQDAVGVRYLVPAISALDANSRRILEWYV